MSSEKKKPKFAYESVFGRTLDEVAGHLNDRTNALAEEGYQVIVEPKETASGTGYAYMIHGRLPDEEEEAPDEGVEISFQELTQEAAGSSERVGKRVHTLMNAIARRVTAPSFELAHKELPSIVPLVIQGMPSNELKLTCDEFEEALKKHDLDHSGGDREKCPLHLLYSTVSSILKDHLRLSLQ